MCIRGHFSSSTSSSRVERSTVDVCTFKVLGHHIGLHTLKISSVGPQITIWYSLCRSSPAVRHSQDSHGLPHCSASGRSASLVVVSCQAPTKSTRCLDQLWCSGCQLQTSMERTPCVVPIPSPETTSGTACVSAEVTSLIVTTQITWSTTRRRKSTVWRLLFQQSGVMLQLMRACHGTASDLVRCNWA